jgi:hypothetical protein
VAGQSRQLQRADLDRPDQRASLSVCEIWLGPPFPAPFSQQRAEPPETRWGQSPLEPRLVTVSDESQPRCEPHPSWVAAARESVPPDTSTKPREGQIVRPVNK